MNLSTPGMKRRSTNAKKLIPNILMLGLQSYLLYTPIRSEELI